MVAHADDFIISDHLIGLSLAQLAAAADLGAVFGELLDPAGDCLVVLTRE